MARAALTLRWLVILTQGATASHIESPALASYRYKYRPPSTPPTPLTPPTPPPSTPSSAPSSSNAPVIIVVAVVVAGILQAAVCIRNWRQNRAASDHSWREDRAARAEATRTTTHATHGADERGDQGEAVPQWYRQGWDDPHTVQMAVAGVPTAAAEEVVPVGLPVAASEEIVTVGTDGSWAPASGGSWVPASGGGDDTWGGDRGGDWQSAAECVRVSALAVAPQSPAHHAPLSVKKA